MEEREEGVAKATVEGSFDGRGTTVVSIQGELDLSSVPEAEQELEPFLRPAAERLVFDLSAVTFMDSSGIAMLLRAAEKVSRVEVRDPSSAVRLIIRATGLADVFHLDS